MNYTKEQLIKEFYKSVQEKYPEYNIDKIETIINGFLNYIRSKIQEDDFQSINIKYFGKFVPLKGKIVGLLRYNQKRLEENKIDNKEYEERTKKLINYINKNQDEFKKFNFKI